MTKPLLAALLATMALSTADAPAHPRRRDQDAALESVRSGRARPLPDLERQVVPQVHGDYLGRPDYDEGANVYRMKFMRGGEVIWVDVDGRTGRILRRSGR